MAAKNGERSGQKEQRRLDPDAVKDKPVREWFSQFARRTSELAGGPWSFATALAIIVAWGLSGPIFHFSDTWQLVINTGTTIITFLMVFVIQHTQNKDTTVIHVKLNELIASQPHASNHLIDLEDLRDSDLERLRRAFQRLADLADEETEEGEDREMSIREIAHAIVRERRQRGSRTRMR